jgi:hypothetical protein
VAQGGRRPVQGSVLQVPGYRSPPALAVSGLLRSLLEVRPKRVGRQPEILVDRDTGNADSSFAAPARKFVPLIKQLSRIIRCQ